MENVRRYRALGQLCRQQAVFHPEAAWHWISEAGRWETLAETEITALFQASHESDAAEMAAA